MNETLSVLSSMAARHILVETAAAFERHNDVSVGVEAMGGVAAVQRLQAGRVDDVVVLAADAMRGLVDSRMIQSASVRVFARSPTAVAVRSGGRVPPGVDAASLKRLVGESRAVGLSTGPSGTLVRAALEQWGFGHKAPTWIVEAPPGVPVAQLLARGDVDVGFQQLSELIGAPGVEVIGPVPDSVFPPTAFAIGLHQMSARIALGKAFVDALMAPAAQAVIRRHGMEPIP